MIGRVARVVPLLALVAGTTGCFATRGDLLVLQNDLAVTRAELLAADSARRQQLDRVLAQLSTTSDTLRSVNQRFTRFQGDVRTDLRSYGEQLVRVQELLGVSQNELRRVRAELEQRTGATPPPAPAGTPPGAAGTPAAGATTPAATPAGGGVPGPNQLYQIGQDQLRRGAFGAGRRAFEDLIRTYPDHDLAPDAMFYIAEAYASEQDEVAADSVYRQVFAKYPRAPRAASAMFKHAVILQNGGRNRDARRVYQDLINRFPRSDEATLASARMRELP